MPELIKLFNCDCGGSIGKSLTKKLFDKVDLFAKMFSDAVEHENLGFIQLMSPLVEDPWRRPPDYEEYGEDKGHIRIIKNKKGSSKIVKILAPLLQFCAEIKPQTTLDMDGYYLQTKWWNF